MRFPFYKVKRLLFSGSLGSGFLMEEVLVHSDNWDSLPFSVRFQLCLHDFFFLIQKLRDMSHFYDIFYEHMDPLYISPLFICLFWFLRSKVSPKLYNPSFSLFCLSFLKIYFLYFFSNVSFFYYESEIKIYIFLSRPGSSFPVETYLEIL